MSENKSMIEGETQSRFGEAPVMPITVRVPRAIEMTGISRTKLYELIKMKEIDIIKIGSSTLIIVASLQSFVERRCNK